MLYESMENVRQQSEKPEANFDEAQVLGLASIGASEQEICDYLGVNRTELMEQFGAAIRKQWAKFRISIRQKQFHIAMHDQGDLRMLQWLGRFNLSQRDSATVQTSEQPVKRYIGIDPDAI